MSCNTGFAFNSTSRVEIFPFHYFGRIVVKPNITHEFFLQILDRTENAAGDDIALDLGEPQFNLVEPVRVGR